MRSAAIIIIVIKYLFSGYQKGQKPIELVQQNGRKNST